MKNLIVYFSFTNNNTLLAEQVAKYIDADVVRITEPKKRTGFKIILDMLFNRTPEINPLIINWAKYDHTILIAPIYDFAIAHPMKSFIQQEKENLKNYSFLTLCIGRDTQKSRIKNQLKTWLGQMPVFIEEFLINDLLPPEQKGKAKYVSNYQVTEEKMKIFEPQIKAFAELISAPVTV